VAAGGWFSVGGAGTVETSVVGRDGGSLETWVWEEHAVSARASRRKRDTAQC
jgi:hypothetical protein